MAHAALPASASKHRFNGAATARSRMAPAPGVSSLRLHPRFNGAATARSRMEVMFTTEMISELKLQWGRDR